LQYCTACGQSLTNPQRFCPACGAPVQTFAVQQPAIRKPDTNRSKALKIIAVVIFGCLFILAIIITASESGKNDALEPKGTYYVRYDDFGTPEKADLYYVSQARNNGDIPGLVSLVSSGRAYKLVRGDKIEVISTDGPIAFVSVDSGYAIGKGVYFPVSDFYTPEATNKQK